MAVEKVTIKPPASLPASFTAGSTVQFTVDIQPSNAANKKVSWSSSNTALATVDATGKVTILEHPKGGTVVITATTNDGAKKATYTLTVLATTPPVITITAHPANKSVTQGGTTTLSVTASVTQSATLGYQWYSNTSNSNTGGTSITGANDKSFAVPTSLTAAKSPYYYFCEVRATGATSVRSNVATVTVTAAVAPLAFTGTYTIPASIAGTAITTLNVSGGASGGTKPYTFTATGLPDGLTMSTAGVISGTPAKAAAAGSATITVKDNSSPQQSKNLTITFGEIVTPLAFTGTYAIPASITGTAMATLNVSGGASGGKKPYTFTAKNLPDGLTISAAGVISGTPAKAAAAGSATITVKDSATPPQEKSLTITYGEIVGPLALTGTVAIPASIVNNAITNLNVSSGASGGKKPYTFTATGLPTGITISTAGVISGKPTTAAAAGSATLTVTDSSTPPQSKNLAITYDAISGVVTISTHPANVTVIKGNTTTLSVAASVTGGATPTYEWYRNTENNNTGGTSLGTGSATYTVPASMDGGTYYYFCQVGATPGATTPVRSSVATVTVFVPVTGISGVPTATIIGTPLTLFGTVAPANATNKTITWSIIDKGATGATISGTAFTATTVGTARVQATILNGASPTTNYTYTFDITVTDPGAVTGVSLGSISGTTIIRDVLQTGYGFTCTVSPTTATNKNVTWSSSNTTVATINASGNITPKGVGPTVITVRTQIGGFEDSFTLKLANLVLGGSGNITESAKDYNKVTLSWGLADLDGLSNFDYTLYRGTVNPIAFNASGDPTNATAVTTGKNLSSYTVTGLSANTNYYFTVVVSGDNICKAHYNQTTILTLPGPIGGTVTISGSGMVNQLLSADISGLTPTSNRGTESYQWQRNGADISGANSLSYTPVYGDIGQTLRMRVRATNCPGEVFSNTVTVAAFSGAGNLGDPYQITSAADLALLAQLVNGNKRTYAVAFYKQTVNINLGVAPYISGAGWTPIGREGSNFFRGTYDGGGKEISGLTINVSSGNCYGLFGVIGGTVKNVKLTGVSISGGSFTGGLVGIANAISTIDHCSVSVTAITGDGGVGGLAGVICDDCNVMNCMVTGGTVSGNMGVGGIAGSLRDAAVIENCYSTCNVSSLVDSAGGVVGMTESGTVVQFCYATGSVTAPLLAGGIAGDGQGTIQNCVALNGKVEIGLANLAIGRITGNSCSLANNYADQAMPVLINGSPLTSITPNKTGLHGLDVTSADFSGANSDVWWGRPAASNGQAFSSSSWNFPKNALPTLKGF